jgi:predicted Rossmann-fold nucleotide-binding protein
MDIPQKNILPFESVPQQLYTRGKLFHGFHPEDPASWAQTADFAIFRHYVMTGRGAPGDPYIGMMRALHDNAITQAATAFITGRRIAAIMGDHRMARDSATYRNIALLARRLTRSGILVCTGGGPGAMEAGHLGASLSSGNDSDLEDALARLASQPNVPALMEIVDSKGAVDPQLAATAHAWFKPAFEIAASLRNPSPSLAFPTWHYGHEPTTPFASHIAKYFQNSIREDGLLALARHGIIYFEGKAGTLQEIFQDGAQNYYRSFGLFSPMVLVGTDYWNKKIPVVPLLEKLFAPEDFAKYVLVTDDLDAAALFIERFNPQE